MATPNIAFLFPGQGSQSVGMGKELADAFPVARSTFEEADDALGYKLSQLCFEGPEDQLTLTEITQPAILTVSVAAWRVFVEAAAQLSGNPGIAASFVAGHSLGEYSANVAAGTIAFADALRTVRSRGQYMQEAVPVGVGAMAAVLGMEIEALREVCADASVGPNGEQEICQPANINSPDQIVISGHKGAVERAAQLATDRGAKRAKLLTVSAPFHSALMQPAQDRLAEDLRALRFADPTLPILCNVDAAAITTADAARDALIRQVTGAVRWDDSIRALIAQGVTTYIELGPGKVLCGLMRQIDRAQKALNVADLASLEKTIAALTVPPAAEPSA